MMQAQSNRSAFSALWPAGASMTDRALRTRPQQALLAILLLAGVTAVLCLYLFQASRTTVTTYGITHLQRNYARLQRENSNLLARFAHEQSMAQMKKRALAAGFGPVAELDYVAVGAAPAAGDSPTLQRQEAR
jgi:hypothetical protein